MTRRDFVKTSAVFGTAVAGSETLVSWADASPTGIKKENAEQAELKYAKLLTKNIVKENKYGGQEVGLSSVPQEIVPPAARISMGISVIRQPHMFHEATHKHSFAEYFFFFGSNPMNMNEFDGAVEFTFGPEQEKHVFSSPTVVAVPPSVYHCPLNYAKVGKPFYCLEAFVTSKWSETKLGEDTTEIRTAEPSYERFFRKSVVMENQWGSEEIGLSAIPMHILPAGYKIGLSASAVKKPYLYHDTTHKHEFTEFFLFLGSNPMDMNEFDAEVEFSLGAEREKHIITSPTIVTVPPGTYHAPINYKKVGKPFYLLEVFPTNSYAAINLETKPA
jgi:hypothetical protein